MLVDILLLSAFLSFVFCLVVSNNSWGRSFSLNILKLILKAVPVLFWQQFSVFSVVYVIFYIYFTVFNHLNYSQSFCCSFRESLQCFFWLFKNVVDYYSCICYCWFYFSSKNNQLNCCWISIQSFFFLNQLQLVCNCL